MAKFSRSGKGRLAKIEIEGYNINMTRRILFGLIPILFLFLALGHGYAEEQPELAFLFFETCPSCEEYQSAQEFSARLHSLDRNSGSYNLALPQGVRGFTAFQGRHDLKERPLTLPVLYEGRHFIVGYKEIEERIEELERVNSQPQE